MKTSPSPSFPRGRLVALIAAGVVLLVLAGVGIYGLILGGTGAGRLGVHQSRTEPAGDHHAGNGNVRGPR